MYVCCVNGMTSRKIPPNVLCIIRPSQWDRWNCLCRTCLYIHVQCTNTTRAAQLMKMAKDLKFRIQAADVLNYLCSENKALISFAVTAKLICVYVFAYAKIGFSHDAAQFWVYCRTGHNLWSRVELSSAAWFAQL